MSVQYREVEIVGSGVDVATFRNYMVQQKLDKYIVEETALRIRAILDRDEVNFLKQFRKEVRIIESTGKVIIFLREDDLNTNVDSIARTFNR